MTPLASPVPGLRVGVSALFDPHDTPHARTFMRALAVARNCVPGLARVQWHFLDDGANAVRGAEVARQMIDWKADLVIGHFSSDAAVSAAALYRQAGIALLTPAATIDCLTLAHPNVFRFCPSDRQLAGDLVNWLASRQWHRVHVQSDDSAHGQVLCVAICEALVRAGLLRVEEPEHADVEVFAGRLKPSREHWQARRQAGSNRPLVLTDDAASPYLGCAEDQRGKTFVIGFGTPDHPGNGCHASALHQTFFAAEPHTYFRESLLMLYVLAELANGRLYAGQLLNALQHTTFNTPLGAVSFDRGELRGAMTCVWTPGPTGLTPVTR
ncbi:MULTISPECIES: ABC transporter substrate-binding protein [Pseudomonas syringae group]|uniref:ABC transporter n=2 Tax=Pseudomonas syringae group TaxID=136849 RepID=A0A2K4WUK5_PSESX|nr:MULTISPECIES: ABC transporter substrate-binding protein [Pseudomonas syringae group]AVB15010.1 amino acid ABC transporter substrate-binding protein [Pseudomonas amygdali pv. morsprunorum]KWS50215.1 ABC transporter [Pseudomonas amygdali pv. morsprunorum]KWS59641.1 ABC transporter [Pseudomonas amygdali pv. morsprunorum]MBI6731394.1 amino acid ABC transporter substrate-binding protein [Pseudomonas amygdali]MBI6813993.1 amino acid ABC transporter substrate-binding protein [Pseudomonas amygdali]